jgi:aryl-alcohol dehydrogenase-like predicted oxidoreductase
VIATAKSLAKRTLGISGSKVSVIGTGLWAVGGGWDPVDAEKALAVIDASLDAGINFFDTADVCGKSGQPEVQSSAMVSGRNYAYYATRKKLGGDIDLLESDRRA